MRSARCGSREATVATDRAEIFERQSKSQEILTSSFEFPTTS